MYITKQIIPINIDMLTKSGGAEECGVTRLDLGFKGVLIVSELYDLTNRCVTCPSLDNSAVRFNGCSGDATGVRNKCPTQS